MKKGWVETTLGGIGNVAMCKRIFKEETTATGDIPFYKIGTFGRKPDAYRSHTYSEYRAKYPFPKRGDVLISASGTIGRRVRYDGEPAYFQDSNIVWITESAETLKESAERLSLQFYGACEWISTKGATISRHRRRAESSSGSWGRWTTRLTASPALQPTPNRISATPAPSSKATCNLFSLRGGRGGGRSNSKRSWQCSLRMGGRPLRPIMRIWARRFSRFPL